MGLTQPSPRPDTLMHYVNVCCLRERVSYLLTFFPLGLEIISYCSMISVSLVSLYFMQSTVKKFVCNDGDNDT